MTLQVAVALFFWATVSLPTLSSTAQAQSRTIGAGGLVIDDGSGNIITILAPPGMASSYIYTLPLSPGGSIVSGYVGAGSSVGQTLYWNGSYWTPSSFLSNTGSGLSITGTLSANGGTGTSGQVLQIDGAGNPVWASIGGTGTVTSVDVSGGTTGLTTSGGPVTNAGTITLGGTLAVANGGTGAATAANAINNLLPAQAGNNGKVLQTDGTNVSWQSATGTVNSVALAAPAEFSVSGSPVTTSGTLTITKANENANTVFAGPASGVPAQPTFRILASADIPNNAANTSGTSAGFTGSLSGDITGTQSATVVSAVGTSSAANVHAAEVLANAATSANTASTIVRRDAAGNFSAGTITASLNGNATTATTAANLSGSNLTNDVSNVGNAVTVNTVGSSTAANIHSAELAANAATNANTASTIVKRDASGNFSAGTITANLTGNASGTASNVTGIVAIANGGTGQSAANAALNALLPSQATNSGKVLETDGTNTSWQSVGGTGTVTSVAISGGTTGLTTSGGPITTSGTITLSGTLAVANGGTGSGTAAGARTNLGAAASGANSDITSLSGLTTPLSIAQGGTGSGTAAGARTNLGTAASGSNSDITSLSGLTTPLSIAQGGTGSGTAAGARTNLGAAASGANSDITSLSGLTTALTVAQGGTGSGTAAGARTNLGAAASGSNSDITSLSGLTTPLSIAQGGTGQTNANNALNALLPSQGTNAGKVLETDGTNTSWQSVGGTGTVTSVAVSGGTTGLTTSGGPITTSGTITLSGTLAVANGGTGSGTAAGARTNLGAAASGANSDITSLSGLTTPLSVAQGGTGSGTAAGARTNLGTAASGSNSDITSLSGLTTPLSVAQGGTGSGTASGARTNLGAAASGANSDITSLSGLTTPLSVAQGGTGSGTAAGARTNLGAAASGANSDIISLSGLTTPLSVAQGGTGSGTAAGARTNLGAAASGANSDITSLSGLTTPLSIAQGGTGSGTAAGARTNLGAAASGANSDITSLSGLTIPLSVAQGGTGAGAFTQGSVVFAGTSGVYTQDNSNFFWDATNHWLGIGTTTPGQKLELKNGNVLLSNGGTAGQLQFQGTGTGLSTFQAGAQSTTTINYTLPISQPTANQVLAATAITGTGPYAVTLGWASAGSGSGWALTGNALAGTEVLGSTNTQPLVIETNGSERMRVLSGGNIGIGTASPVAKLSVSGGPSWTSSAWGGALSLDYSTAMGWNGNGVGQYIGTTNIGMAFFHSSDQPGATANPPVYDMVIATNGKVGIGNTGPAQALDITGNANVSGSYYLSGHAFLAEVGANGTFVGNTENTANTGNNNTFVGHDAGTTNSSGAQNTAVGESAMRGATNTGNDNVAVGYHSLYSITSGLEDAAVGAHALENNSTGFYNAAFGWNALGQLLTGTSNTAVGYFALGNASDPSGQTAIGYRALNQASGSYNVALGYNAGQTNTTGTYNTFLGTNADAGSGNLTNAAAIGANAQVTQSNSLVLGSISGTNGASTDAKIGIGTTSPGEKLELKNGNLLLSNGGTATQLQLQGTGSGLSTFQAGAQGSTSINYTLPTTAPSSNQVLTATGVSGSAVTLGWSTGASAPLFSHRTTDTGYASTTPGNDNTLYVALAANATYTFEAFLSCSDSNASGITGKIAFIDSSSTYLKFGANSSGNIAPGPSVGTGSGNTAGTVNSLYLENANLSGADQNFIYVKGIVINGSSAGNLHLRCGISATGAGHFMRLYTNSYLTATRVQ